MIELRPFATLGSAVYDWLDARYHFSFADYHDPERVNWGSIRVWNDDTVQPGAGFPPHPHRDMEIITYVRDGTITHRDDLGNEGRTEAGDVQVMSAGTGVTHSEYNLEPEVARVFQIWIIPERQGERPAWGTKPFPRAAWAGAFVTLASGMRGDEEALPIRADARVAGATIKAGDTVRYPLGKGRHAYLVAARGRIRVGDVTAAARDGVAVREEPEIAVRALEDSEVVLVDAA
jgi:hypothetical protein